MLSPDSFAGLVLGLIWLGLVVAVGPEVVLEACRARCTDDPVDGAR